jgi:hypothetical protein
MGQSVGAKKKTPGRVNGDLRQRNEKAPHNEGRVKKRTEKAALSSTTAWWRSLPLPAVFASGSSGRPASLPDRHPQFGLSCLKSGGWKPAEICGSRTVYPTNIASSYVRAPLQHPGRGSVKGGEVFRAVHFTLDGEGMGVILGART